jgi:ParB-like chromosome segregation protein Spo0J
MIPALEYSHEFEPTSARAAIKAAGAASEQLLMVPLDQLIVDPEFNVRIHNAKLEDHIEAICLSITNNGFYRHKPLPGYAGKNGMGDGIYVVGGFTRLEAAKRARKAGVPIDAIPVVLRNRGTNTGDLLVALDNDNTGKPLLPYERAIVCKRLKAVGWAERRIAEGMGITQSYVNGLLSLLEMPQALQNLVIEEQVSASLAIETVRRVGHAQALALITADISMAGPLLDNSAAPRRRNKGTRLSSKVCLTAIDLALDRDDIGFLRAWRKGDQTTIVAVNDALRRPRNDRVGESP